jgi:hypothetical protein
MAGRKDEKQKHSYASSQLLNFTRDSYLERTSRPIYAIVFLLPFIIFYEVGTILINTDVLSQYQVRVVAFVWLQDLLARLGTGDRVAWVAPPTARWLRPAIRRSSVPRTRPPRPPLCGSGSLRRSRHRPPRGSLPPLRQAIRS